MSKINIGNYFIDPRDGHRYKTVKIGNQIWMAENLAYLPSVNSGEDGSTTDPRYYVYDYNGTDVAEAKSQTNYTTHGVLYNHPAARVACPTGWHLPTDAEWNTLEQYVVSVINSPNPQYSCSTSETGWRRCADDTETDAGANGVGQALKQLGLGSGVGQGTDLVGFNAKIGGHRDVNSAFFRNFGASGNWWSSSVSDGHAWRRYLYSSYSTVYRNAYNQGYGFSVRCLRD